MERKSRRRYRLGSDPAVHRVHSTWYRGPDSRFTPSSLNLRERDALLDYVLQGWVPPSPPVDRSANVLSVGSCFAQHFAGNLRVSRGKPTLRDDPAVNLIAFGGGFNNTFTVRRHFDWALGHEEIESATLFVEDPAVPVGRGMHKFKLVSTSKARGVAKQAILSADVFYITLGVAEVWCDSNNEPLFGSVPYGRDLFADWHNHSPERHVFRVSSVSENLENVRAIYRTLRNARPDAAVVFSICPARMLSTFRPVACLSANSASKAILRAAVDEFLREDPSGAYYWPAFEMVVELYGPKGYAPDFRHLRPEVVRRIADAFERYFLGVPKKRRSPRRRAMSLQRR